MRPTKLVLLFVGAAILAGCGTSRPASVKGECRVFERPTWPVKGQSARDQDWIDETIESGVAGCGWPRPRLGLAK